MIIASSEVFWAPVGRILFIFEFVFGWGGSVSFFQTVLEVVDWDFKF